MATLFTLAFALGGYRSGISRLTDNSFFWHLRTGHQILDHGIPRTDIYSFTAAGTDWVVQSWLAEVLYALVDSAFGPFGVRMLGALTGALVGTFVYRLTLRIVRDRLRATGLVLAGLGASFTLWSERPLFLGILAFIGLLWMVEVPDSWLGRRPLMAMPVLMWLWINIHGSFSLGFVYLGLHVVGRWADGEPPWQGREREITKAAVLAFAVCLVNPYGPTLVLFPVELLSRGDILKRVIEWRSPEFRSVQGVAFAAWMAVFVCCLAAGRHRPSRRDLIVSVPFLLLAFWAQRNIAVAPLVGLPVVARAVAGSERPEPGQRLNRPLGALLLLLAGLWTAEASSLPDFDLDRYPVRAMRAVEEQGLLGQRLMTNDRWGGYLILRWWPRQEVFVDDRYDMYPTDLMHDFIRFSDADRRWREILDRYRIDVVVWDRDVPVVQLMDKDPAWRRVHRDRLAVVFVRR